MGKSKVAVVLAERLGGEIISVDSMQVYRGLDLGTAKPSPDERSRVAHHLIDVVGLTEPFDAGQFARRAADAVTEIQGRGRIPILCGGTGLYFRAFIQGLGDAPPANASLRKELEATPLADLIKELEARDPATFQAIDHQNPRRVIRAVEVIRQTGKPFSSQRAAWTGAESTGRAEHRFFALSRPQAELMERIDARVDAMFERGLVAETEQLLALGLRQNQTAMQAIGYRQVAEHLRGERSLSDTIALVKVRTRQFAKRQRTWFRHQAHAQWLTISAEEKSDEVADRLTLLWNE